MVSLSKMNLREISQVLLALFTLLIMGLSPRTSLALVSDDFNHPNLDSSVWSFVDPVGDSSVTLSGAGSGEATVAITIPAGQAHDIWTTDEPASSRVNFGTTTAYASTPIIDSTLFSAHSLSLSGLTPGTTYHYQVTSVDGSGNAASSADLSFTTRSNASTIVSDDFSVK